MTLLWQPDLAPLKSMHVCDIVTSQILAGPVRSCKDACKAQAGRARKHRKKGGYFSQFEWYSSKGKKSNFLRKVSWS